MGQEASELPLTVVAQEGAEPLPKEWKPDAPFADAKTPVSGSRRDRWQVGKSAVSFLAGGDRDASLLLNVIGRYHGEQQFNQVVEAYHFAKWAHRNSTRKDGRPYFTHPFDVALLAAEHSMRPDAVAAALLHDVVEDESVALEDINELFGERVATIVSGLTKLEASEVGGSDPKPETLKRILMESAESDIRILLIKLLDRFHNIQSIKVFPAEKQKRIAWETLQFHVPLASRLGLFRISREMEDHIIAALHPREHARLSQEFLKLIGKYREETVRRQKSATEVLCSELPWARVKIVPKHLSEIRSLLRQKTLTTDQVDMIPAFNMETIVPDESSCYVALGILHKMFSHAQFVRDFIHSPKLNGYRSLHTTLVFKSGRKVNAVIRTEEMDQEAELGIIPLIQSGGSVGWLRDLVKDFDEVEGHEVAGLTDRLVSPEIEVFTPAGETFKVLAGATALDFAYGVHTEVGDRAVSALVNGRSARLKSTLKAGDSVQILTDPASGPKIAWLSFVRTDRARLAIRRGLRKADEETHVLGIDYANDYLGRFGVSLPLYDSRWSGIADEADYPTPELMWKDLAYGRLHHANLLRFVLPHLDQEEILAMAQGFCERRLVETDSALGVEQMGDEAGALRRWLVGAVDDWVARTCPPHEVFELPDVRHPIPIAVRNCCRPEHGQPIVAIAFREQGAVIHRTRCKSIRFHRELAFRNVFRATWAREPRVLSYHVRFVARNHPSVIGELARTLETYRLGFEDLYVSALSGDLVEGYVRIQASELEDLSRAFRRLGAIGGVTRLDYDDAGK